MPAARDSRTLLTEALAQPEIDVLRAALSIAADEYPEVDLEASIAEIERLAEEVRELLPSTSKLEPKLQALAHVLGGVHGFAGNVRDYADPKNSYLNEVIGRRVGIPISLSLVYQEVGRRAGLDMHGIAFPGHFLVAGQQGEQQGVLDPFHHGKLLGPDDLRGLLSRCAPGMAFSPQLLRPATARQFVFRMLSNLKQLYMGAGDFSRALRTVELLLIITPDHPGELRARASVLQSLGAFSAALSDVQHCLALSPNAPDAAALRWTAQALASRAEWQN